MGEYNNNELLKEEIINQSRHQIIYGYNTETRTALLKQIEEEYPLKTNTNEPIALYFDSIGLSCDSIQKNDSYLINIICKEYLNITIIYKIIKKIELMRIQELDEKIIKLFKMLSQEPIKSIKDILNQLQRTKEIYKNYFKVCISKKTESIPIEQIPIPFIQIEMLIKDLKEIMNIDSYFGIILEKKQDISTYSTKAINDLIGSRINKDISMKLAIEPNEWKTFFGNSGQLIEYPHDYGMIELDDSYQKHMKKIVKE